MVRKRIRGDKGRRRKVGKELKGKKRRIGGWREERDIGGGEEEREERNWKGKTNVEKRGKRRRVEEEGSAE